MWKKLNNSYFLRYRCEPGKKTVFVTDFMTIWCNQFLDATFLDILKESNFILVNIDNTELLEKGMRTLGNPEEAKITTVSLEGAGLKMSMSAEYGYPFSLDLHLNEGSRELMVTQPLLKSVCDLRSSERDLIMELQKKDKEIEEYKAEGGRIALKHLKTRRFNIEAHISCHSVYEENFCVSTIPQEILDKDFIGMSVKHEICDSSNIKTENEDIKDSITIKEEPQIEINQVIKDEPDTQFQPTVSPRKTQKRKLKL